MNGFDEILQRIAKQISENELRRRDPPSYRYRIEWTPTLWYTPENVELIVDDGVGSCVYELWQIGDGIRTAVYVGETNDLGRRLQDHQRTTEPNPQIRGADFSRLLFSYAPLDGVIARKAVERGLWKLYRYSWNDADGPHGGRVTGRISIGEHFPEPYTINFNGVRTAMYGVDSPVVLP